MIGVIAHPAHHDVICEFFELFKTPWEFYCADREYDVVLCDQSVSVGSVIAKALIIFDGPHRPDTTAVADGDRDPCGRFLLHKDLRIPIYRQSSLFPEKNQDFLIDAESRQAAGYVERSDEQVLVRIGYSLFDEVMLLLTVGQESANAAFPTLELHISLLRNSIVANGIALLEIPPTPEGYRFIGCLTHDIDHPLLRKHWCDHTMFGFLYRAIARSLFEVFRGRIGIRKLLTNWGAALKLPFVYMGLAEDFWQGFVSYPKLEAGLPSSFFVIPFKGNPGRLNDDMAPTLRASAYGASDISHQLRILISAGCEIGLHGIDAWRDSSSAAKEMEEVRRITGQRELGVRMHWLYRDQESPVVLERAGAEYDSSIGFNDAVGYRAGATQVYKPLGANRLLELPLHIMDTALFFPTYLDLSTRDAGHIVDSILANAEQYGGTVTINWHDRSIAPERQWDDFYRQLIDKLKNKRAWFATSADAVLWFRRRRSMTFERVEQSETIRLKMPDDGQTHLPGLLVRVHNAEQKRIPQDKSAEMVSAETMDISAQDGMFVGSALVGMSVNKAGQ